MANDEWQDANLKLANHEISSVTLHAFIQSGSIPTTSSYTWQWIFFLRAPMDNRFHYLQQEKKFHKSTLKEKQNSLEAISPEKPVGALGRSNWEKKNSMSKRETRKKRYGEIRAQSSREIIWSTPIYENCEPDRDLDLRSSRTLLTIEKVIATIDKRNTFCIGRSVWFGLSLGLALIGLFDSEWAGPVTVGLGPRNNYWVGASWQTLVYHSVGRVDFGAPDMSLHHIST